ncbi:MAG: hypothetical protein IJW45_06375 [Oscillospiraceae bacterium]|nr:hypothetical protein [Oscillospiraceae bacterium]
MMTGSSFCIRFSDITIKFDPAAPVGLPDEFIPFLCEDDGNIDAEFKIAMLRSPIVPQFPSFHDNRGTIVYTDGSQWLHIYPLHRPDDGCQVACLLTPEDKNTLFYPAALWDHYTSVLHCIHLICIERILLKRDAFLLHSSVVRINDAAVLFTGPSGAGKSTQADLWKRHLCAEILNGDRCVIMKRGDRFYGGGSPLSGSSGIYEPGQAPIAGIFILNKSEKNRIRRAGADAFIPLFSQTLINSWDSSFMDKITSLYQDLLVGVPIYHLDCRPDADAVELAYRTIF